MERLKSINSLQVVWVGRSARTLKAKVQASERDASTHAVDLNLFTCTCGWPKVYEEPCVHLHAAARKAQFDLTKHAKKADKTSLWKAQLASYKYVCFWLIFRLF